MSAEQSLATAQKFVAGYHPVVYHHHHSAQQYYQHSYFATRTTSFQFPDIHSCSAGMQDGSKSRNMPVKS